nr:hypothetical protein B0A51_04782 [Rachicladosporium sp. CCFEE 5018]
MPASTKSSARKGANANGTIRSSVKFTTPEVSFRKGKTATKVAPKAEDTRAAVPEDASDDGTLDGEDDDPCTTTDETMEEVESKGPQLVLQKLAFKRLVREITLDLGADLQMEAIALQALQEASEAMLVQHFTVTQNQAAHAGRETISVEDMRQAAWLRKKIT